MSWWVWILGAIALYVVIVVAVGDDEKSKSSTDKD